MYLKDIREQKRSIRQQCLEFRMGLPTDQKTTMDSVILKRALALQEYADADVLYTYVSKEAEADTKALISAALEAGKFVAVPRCEPKTLRMKFLEISSLSDLESGTYGVLEPIPQKCPPVRDSGKAFCIVPGLCFDFQGYRLGYGKGYYDRFLSEFSGFTVGLCYAGCVHSKLPHGFYDRPVDMLVTEKYIRKMAGSQPRRRQEDLS